MVSKKHIISTLLLLGSLSALSAWLESSLFAEEVAVQALPPVGPTVLEPEEAAPHVELSDDSAMSLKAKSAPCKTSEDAFCELGDLSPSKQGPGGPQLAPPVERKLRKKRTIIDNQSYTKSQTMTIVGKGAARGEVHLINLNANFNRWYALRIFWPHQDDHQWFHLETLRPESQRIRLDKSFINGIIISENGGEYPCELWSSDGSTVHLAEAKPKPYTSICDDRLYLRQRIEGYRTTKEWVVEFLRDRVWGGAAITELVKSTLYKDRYLIGSKVSEAKVAQQAFQSGAPHGARLAPEFRGKLVEAKGLGIAIHGGKDEQVVLGQWYRAKRQKGVFISVLEADAVSQEILGSHADYVKKLGKVEGSALNYLIAFDMAQFRMDFAIGTDHPRLGWSQRVPKANRDLSLPGPDGIDSYEPIAPTGLIAPHLAEKVVATFTGGFKRSHGAFRWGDLATSNFGTHYGFIENGVIFSSMQAGLATIVIYKNGRIAMKTWDEEDEVPSHMAKVLHARQNGMPIISFDHEALIGVPGRYVSNWTMGNWSGSQEREFRTLRAGVCLKQQMKKQFLIYGYFSSVTPTAMARVFQAYGCDYAMHLDMNALEHTYLALYPENKGSGNVPEQLIKGMKVLDQRFKGNVPRFLGYPDNRDYFYLSPRGRKP